MQSRLNIIFKFFFLSFFLSLWLLSTDASAFYRTRWGETGVKAFWATKDFPLRFSAVPSLQPDPLTALEFENALSAVTLAWMTAAETPRLLLNHGALQVAPTIQYVISEIADPDLGLSTQHLWTDAWPFGSGTIAVTILFARGKNGEIALEDEDLLDGSIIDADILYNAENYAFCVPGTTPCEENNQRPAMDLVTVALHEWGHLLGLDHQPRSRDAVMFPSITPGESKALSKDEVFAARCLYSETRNEQWKTMCSFEDNAGGPPGSTTYLWGERGGNAGCGSVRGNPPGSSGSPLLPVLCLFLIGWVLRKRRQLFPLDRGRRLRT